MTRQYIGARYVPLVFGDWVSGRAYEPLTIVTYNNSSYTSKKDVPTNIGNPFENPEYWALTGNYNAQVTQYAELVQQYRGEVTALDGRVDDVEGDITSLGGRIDDTNDDVTALANRLTQSSANIIIVGAGHEYTKPSDAVAYARQHCSATNRYLIFVLPGEYTDYITLQTNPGIDIIGYGATIKSAVAYPNAPLYTSGTGTFVGLTFEYTGTDTNYGCHIEHNAGNEAYNGYTRFVDCHFKSSYHGIGIGMTGGSTVEMINCVAETTDLEGTRTNVAGLYLHNRAENADKQTFIARGCKFIGYHDIRIDDACNYWGATGYTSELELKFTNCTGHKDNLCLMCTNPNEDASYIKNYSNVHLSEESMNNAFLALNKETWQPIKQSMAVSVTQYGQLFVPVVGGLNTNGITLVSAKVANDGVNFADLGAPAVSNNYSHGWVISSSIAQPGAVVFVELTYRPN